MAQYLYDNYSDRISICEISPEKYNNLYDSMKKRGKNLNHLLAWSHARAIENLLVKGYKVEGIISDKFGNDNLIENALMSNGRKFKLIQKTKAEEDIAVATASVLARCRFIGRLEEMNEKYNMKFPKGAGEKVPDALEEFILNHGKENLNKVAKVHFSITEKTLI